MYLNCKTYFSLRYGTYSTRELVEAAEEAGATVLALTNINNTSDHWDFVKHCRERNIKPIVGVEIRNENKLCYVLLARNNEGYYAINKFLSEQLIARKPFPDRCPLLCHNEVYVIYPFGVIDPALLQPHEMIGVQTTEVNKLFSVRKELLAKFVIRHPVTFQNKRCYNLHRILRAVDMNILLSDQQPDHIAGVHETFISIRELMTVFNLYPQIITNTFHLLNHCTIEMDYVTDKNKRYYTASKKDDLRLLEKLSKEGLQYRYGNKNKEAKSRITNELKVIDELDFSAYFLITWDYIRYAVSRGFFYVGRGSGANSIVAYCLKITDVEPITLDLYFERFLNSQRTSPPDFDIDFSWTDRDEVMDYVFKRYGEEHVALLGMVSTFQSKAAIREFGKVWGLPKEEIDELVAGKHSPTDQNHQQILYYANMVRDWPNGLSIHPCGILISEKPIHYYTSTTMLQKQMPVTHIDMFVAENIGLSKFDILSQRGLGHIKDTLKIVRETRGIDLDIHKVEQFKTDLLINDNLAKGNSIGCFYIESPSMRNVLRKLQCNNYITLVAASSIIRPGVGSSGMMQQYIWRYHHRDKFEYLHPIMKDLLEETFGVMVYQEDVIKIGHYFGGLTLAEADTLRRAMSGKYRGQEEMRRVEQKFFDNCREKEYPESVYREVWRQMASFAGYSFSKAHSASFAVESYQSLYLKTYYPIEFLVAVINNMGGFYNTELYFLQLKKAGANVLAPCVNKSENLTAIVDGNVYVGFQFVKDLQASTVETILGERYRDGAYQHLHEFIERTNVSATQLELLIDVGALRFTGKTKKQLLWEASFLQSKANKHIPAHQSFFNDPQPVFDLPMLEDHSLEDMLQEIEILRFPLGNIFDLLQDDPYAYKLAKDIPGLLGKEAVFIGYLVCTKDTYTKKEQRLMHFGTWVDAEGNWLDSVHFPNAAMRYKFQGRGFYKIKGVIVEEFGEYAINVTGMVKVGIKQVRG